MDKKFYFCLRNIDMNKYYFNYESRFNGVYSRPCVINVDEKVNALTFIV